MMFWSLQLKRGKLISQVNFDHYWKLCQLTRDIPIENYPDFIKSPQNETGWCAQKGTYTDQGCKWTGGGYTENKETPWIVLLCHSAVCLRKRKCECGNVACVAKVFTNLHPQGLGKRISKESGKAIGLHRDKRLPGAQAI